MSAGTRSRHRPGRLPWPPGRGHGDPVRHRRAGDRLPAAAWRRRLAPGHRPGELGQHEQLHADRDPAVHPDGRDHAAFGPQLPDLSRPVEAGLRHPGRAAADQYRGLRAVRRDQRLQRRDRGLDRPRRAAATAASATTPAAVGGLARRRRHARHPDPAVDRHDRLRHLHRNLGGEAVHGRRRARPAADRPVHGLYRRPRLVKPGDRPAREGPAEHRPSSSRRLSDVLPFVVPDRRHDGQHLCRLGDADRGGRRRAALFGLVVSAIWGELDLGRAARRRWSRRC